MRRTAAALAICVLAACSPETSIGATSTTFSLAPICQQLADELINEMQGFIDQFAEARLDDFPEGELPGLETLGAEVEAARTDALERGCGDYGFEDMLALEARDLSGEGPVGRTLAAMLRGFDPSSIEPTTVELGPDDDLPVVIAELGDGSTVELAAGDYQLDEALLVDRALTIHGAGKDVTRIRSSAPQAAVLVIAGGSLELADLSIAHTSDSPATVVVATGASGLTIDSVRVSGGVADSGGESGGHGLTIVGAEEGSSQSQITDSEFVENELVGVALFGSADTVISGGTASENGVCGICLFDEARATLEGSTLIGNEVGLGASGTAILRASGVEVTDSTVAAAVIESSATATVEDSSFTGNESGIQTSGSTLVFVQRNDIEGGEVALLILEQARAGITDNTISGAVIGLQVGDLAAPVVRSNRIVSSESAAVVYSGSVGGLLADNTLSEAGEVSVQVAGSARPRISGNDIEGPGPVGVNYTDESRGLLVGNTISGLDAGVQVSGTAAPDLESNVFEDLDEYSIVVFDDASGTISGNTCASGAPGIILVGGADPALTDNDCSVVRG